MDGEYIALFDITTHCVVITDHSIRRFGTERINPVHVGKSLVYFSDADSDPEPAYTKGKKMNWESIKKFYRGHVKQFVLDLEISIKNLPS